MSIRTRSYAQIREQVRLRSAWIGVDLDGTLANDETWRGLDYIGPPVPAMLARVKDWLAKGRKVKIFTARVSVPDECEQATKAIDAWCEAHLGQRLECTCSKDFNMIELWDDRARRVVKNKGTEWP